MSRKKGGVLMRKIGLLFILCFCINVVYAGEVEIEIDDELVEFTEIYGLPFIDEYNRTQVPLRTIMERFGADVTWDGEKREVIVDHKGIEVIVPIGENHIFVDGELLENDTYSRIIDGRTFLPIRIVLEAFDAEVLWDSEKSRVSVKRKDAKRIVANNEVDTISSDFQLEDRNMNLFTLSENRGQKIILSFFTTY